jgi:hypothetical protein
VTEQDETVTGLKQRLSWIALVAGGIAWLAVGAWFAAVRLEDADKWGSAIGGLIAVLGLPIAVYGVVLARRAGTTPDRRPSESGTNAPVFGGDALAEAYGDGSVAIGQVGRDVTVTKDPAPPDPPQRGR